MNTSHIKTAKGFTLIEALIAISILLVGVTGALTAASQGITSATYSKEDVIAFNLAQEAIETVRNTRDNNGISRVNWLTGIANSGDPCEIGATSCMVDVNDSSGIFLHSCGGIDACPPLKQDPNTGAYGYNASWPDSPYTRTVTITQPAQQLFNSDQIVVTVKISWSHGLSSRSFTAQENLYNWQL